MLELNLNPLGLSLQFWLPCRFQRAFFFCFVVQNFPAERFPGLLEIFLCAIRSRFLAVAAFGPTLRFNCSHCWLRSSSVVGQ